MNTNSKGTICVAVSHRHCKISVIPVDSCKFVHEKESEGGAGYRRE